jgi:hypothetical protein
VVEKEDLRPPGRFGYAWAAMDVVYTPRTHPCRATPPLNQPETWPRPGPEAVSAGWREAYLGRTAGFSSIGASLGGNGSVGAPARLLVVAVHSVGVAASLNMANPAQFGVCINNDGYKASLEVGKLYHMEPDREAASHGYIRVIDESGEDYGYSENHFFVLEVPKALATALQKAA